jgi:hypothetical protein
MILQVHRRLVRLSSRSSRNSIKLFKIQLYIGQFYLFQVDSNISIVILFKFDESKFYSNQALCYKSSSNLSDAIMYDNLKIETGRLGAYWFNDSSRINIIATDYTTYAVIAYCNTRFGSNVRVLTRSLNLGTEGYNMINVALDRINFSPGYLVKTPFGSLTCSANSLSSLGSILLAFCMIILRFI